MIPMSLFTCCQKLTTLASFSSFSCWTRPETHGSMSFQTGRIVVIELFVPRLRKIRGIARFWNGTNEPRTSKLFEFVTRLVLHAAPNRRCTEASDVKRFHVRSFCASTIWCGVQY